MSSLDQEHGGRAPRRQRRARLPEVEDARSSYGEQLMDGVVEETRSLVGLR